MQVLYATYGNISYNKEFAANKIKIRKVCVDNGKSLEIIAMTGRLTHSFIHFRKAM